MGSKEALFKDLEPWTRRLAASIARRTGLSRWLEDIEQDILVALWEAIAEADGRGDTIAFIKQRVQHRARDAVRRYSRWTERELSGLLDSLIDSD